MGCGRAREEERPYRERPVREGGGADRAYQRAANGAAMKLFAATPGREEWGRRLAREPGEEDRVPVRLLGGTLQGGGEEDAAGPGPREEERAGNANSWCPRITGPNPMPLRAPGG